MGIAQAAILALNRGLISQLGLARTDLKRMALSASIQTNLMPRMLGSASFRPGLQYVASTLNNAKAKYIPFVFGTTDVALVEATDSNLRFLLPGSDGTPSVLLSRVAVGSTITNGTFAGSLTGWTGADQAGATSDWVNLNSTNFMRLIGNGTAQAVRYQQVTVAGGDLNKEHALRIVVYQGVVTLNVGTSAGDGAYAFNQQLGAGTHSIAFTPSGNFYVQFSNGVNAYAHVQSIAIEAAGVVTLPTPWVAATLPLLRWEQSGGVVYVASGMEPQKILRWGAAGQSGARSWSLAKYRPLDGPFLTENVGSTTLAPAELTGEAVITSSQPFFQPGHVGALVRIESDGQDIVFNAGGANQWSSPIEINGVGNARYFGIKISGTFVGTIVLQMALGAPEVWQNIGPVSPGSLGVPSNANWTAVGNASTWTGTLDGFVYDGWDNQTIFYRIGFEGTYTSGTATCELSTSGGSKAGIARIVTVSSTTAATAEILTQPGNTGTLQGFGSASNSAVTTWSEGAWSDVKGWPTAVALHEGRLCWAGKDRFWGSVSDAYESFDDTVAGDSGPISRQIGSGPVDSVNWLLALADLLMDTPAREIAVRSSSLGGIITPTDLQLKDCATQGGAAIPALKIDYNGVFVQRSQRRIYLLTYTPSFFLMDYKASDLTNFVPDIAITENGVPIASPGINWLAVQRQPDTRIHALLNDGTARVMVFDPDEDEHAWIKVQTATTVAGAGQIVDCVVLPGQGGATSAEDLVYYEVARTVGGQTVYCLERWAREDECLGGALSKNMDSHLFGTNSPASASISLPHLVGEQVAVWADGAALVGTFTVGAGGAVTLPKNVTNWCAGLSYQWQFQSTKLAYAAQLGTPLLQKKKVARLGIVTANMAAAAVKYGPDFAHLRSLPSTYKGRPVAAGEVFAAWDDETFQFPGEWDTDSRVCLQGASPLPVTVLAIVADMETREKA